MARAHGLVMLLALLGTTASAQAQDDFEDDVEEGLDEEGLDEEGDLDQDLEEGEGAEAAGGEDAPKAKLEPRDFFVGPYVRLVWVPSFIQNIFLDEAPNVVNPGFGIQANLRGETSSVMLGLGYTGYSFEDAMRENGGEPGETEWANSDLGLLHVTASLLWRAELAEKLELQYGIGLDFGIVTGELIRTEAYRNLADQWAPCDGPLNPDPFYCGTPRITPAAGTDPYDRDGEQYGVKEEDIPPIFAMPMLPHLRLRYEIIPELAGQLEMSYGIVQFWVGLSVVYGLQL